MDNKKDIFKAIVDFVNDLWEIYGTSKKITPFTLYHRLFTKIKEEDEESVDKVIGGFVEFFSKYDDFIIANDMNKIPRDTHIRYNNSEKIYLPIQMFIHKSEDDISDAIRRHLIAISALIAPDEKKANELMTKMNKMGIDEGTKEGAFLAGIMSKVEEEMSGTDVSDPKMAMMNLMSSGVMGDMMTGMQNGKMNPKKLMKTMHGIMGKFIPDDSDSDENSKEENSEEK